MKHKVHQVQGKQIDIYKVCSKCPPLTRTQARKGCWVLVNCIINQRLLQAPPGPNSFESFLSMDLPVRRGRHEKPDAKGAETEMRGGELGVSPSPAN